MKTDIQLKKDIENELEWEPAIDAAKIGIEVKDGVVTLAGHLDSYPAKLAAEKAAQRVAGVKGVAIEIDVDLPGSSHQTDADLARASANVLQWNALVPKGKVHVTSENSWIKLSGEVEWEFQRKAAEAAIRSLIGVRGVQNEIRLRPRVSPNNIKVQIEAALQRRAHLDTKAISVRIEEDKVVLEGEVNSISERRIIEDATWAAPGVTTVIDRLKITT